MIHQPLGGFQGQATDIQIRAREMQRVKDKMNRLLAEMTGQPFERLEADTERDNFMDADEAMEYGLIDRIIASRHDVPTT
jgi:ATP-dependent Clp protease protease subunit